VATQIEGKLVVDTYTEFGVEEHLIPGVIIEVDDLDEAEAIQNANPTGITVHRRMIHVTDWETVINADLSVPVP